jgi:transcription elongation factor Elf1
MCDIDEDKIDHEYTDEIVCPFCGCEFIDSWEYSNGDEDIGLLECGNCGKEFYATRRIDITYSTKKATYGTCNKCKAENVVIEDHHSTIGSYKGLCVKCGKEEEKRLLQVYFDSTK